MNRFDLQALWHLASPHHRETGRGWLDLLAQSLRLATVGLMSGVIWIHLHLWQIGYRHIPTIGPLFLAGAVSSLAVTAVLLVRPSRLFGVLVLAVDQAILVSLIASINLGLFGFQESLNGQFVVESIALEALTATAVLLWVGLDLAAEIRCRPTTMKALAHLQKNPRQPGTQQTRHLDFNLVEHHDHDAA